MVFDYFFLEGWVFFYKLVLNIIKTFADDIINNNFIDNLITICPEKCNEGVKPKTFKKIFSFVPIVRKRNERDMWKKLIKDAKNIQIDEDYIKLLWDNFDKETRTFKIAIDTSLFF